MQVALAARVCLGTVGELVYVGSRAANAAQLVAGVAAIAFIRRVRAVRHPPTSARSSPNKIIGVNDEDVQTDFPRGFRAGPLKPPSVPVRSTGCRNESVQLLTGDAEGVSKSASTG